ncbi:molecular chaperone [Pseudomonas sp. CDFA 602]|uniref:fimbrial biogenesis chaperone n=1 Tax=Pseudomonas californiensis TaxID=2829823 RepID=UPI001E4CECD6|nr:molecular chaperone [Pseudomonas californiensis]MCD5993931.1 molecular chaperone [Pseudomonas californiensis]MCD5999566.1 molecular chaperone [Pseudomonas californiensis]
MVLDFFRCVALIAMALYLPSAQAGIVLNTTRVIYQGSDKEASLGVQNTGTGEILLQSWLEAGLPRVNESASDKPSEDKRLPLQGASDLSFIVTPALARMPGGGRQLLRIIHSGANLPADRESVLWLNVQEIPQTAAENTLQVAIRQRIKVFFRPKGLQGDPLQAPEKLQWKLLAGDVLRVDNTGPYHVSMLKITAQQRGRELATLGSGMLAPHQQLILALAHRSDEVPVELSFISINDFGGQVRYSATLSGSDTGYARKTEPR